MKRYNENFVKTTDPSGKRIMVAPKCVGGKLNPTYDDFIENGYSLMMRTEPEEREGYVSSFDCWKEQTIDGKRYLVMTWTYEEIVVEEDNSDDNVEVEEMALIEANQD